jgi:hypothetical protein
MMFIRHHGTWLAFSSFFLLLSFNLPSSSRAIELDPYPVDFFSRDVFSIYAYREERPGFYWVNIGVPDAFFEGVKKISDSPLGFSVRSIEYGVRASYWLSDVWQIRLTLPMQAIAIEDTRETALHTTRIGDVEIGSTFLFQGDRKKGNFIGLDGWLRLPTGSNPFRQAFPLLSTGKGVPQETFGIVSGQQVGGFSFFQSIHYETTQPLTLDSSNPALGPGVFQWPDNFHALGRIEWLVFQRAQRFASLFLQVRLRMSGLMKLDDQSIYYGQSLVSDQLYFATGGLTVRVDKDFSVGSQLSSFPFLGSTYKSRPDFGWLFTLSLMFSPI